MNELIMGLNLYMSFFETLKEVCENKRCAECFFRIDHVCILDCEPEDYNLDIIREAVQKTLEKEIAENGNR